MIKKFKSASIKAKGRNFQNEVCTLLAMYLNAEFSNISEDPKIEIKGKTMGNSGVDVVLSPRLLKIFPFSIECKRTEKLDLKAWMRQSENNCLSNTFPVVIYRRSKEKAKIIIKLKDYQKFFLKRHYFFKIRDIEENLKEIPKEMGETFLILNFQEFLDFFYR